MGNRAITLSERIRRVLLPVFLLFWLFCLPLAFAIYTPHLYQANCLWNDRCERMGEIKTQQHIDELTGFFLHRTDQLQRPWTGKEHQHLREVRDIYDKVILAFAVITLLFISDIWLVPDVISRYKQYARTSLLISVGLFVLALIIIPFFNAFWMKVFHPLLFDNDLWRTNPRDVSWYLMPKAFFMRVIIFICLVTLSLNLLLWLVGRKLEK